MSQFSNQVVSSSTGMIALLITNDPTGLRSLLCPRDVLLGVIKSKLCKSPVTLSKAKGWLLIVFDVCTARVSWWVATRNASYSTLILECRWPFKSKKLIFIESDPLRSWLPPSSGRRFFAYSTSHASRINDWMKPALLQVSMILMIDVVAVATAKHTYQYFDCFALIV